MIITCIHCQINYCYLQSNAGDAFSQVRVKAKTWKTDNNTTPLVTTPLVTTAPPLSHGPSPQKKQPPKNKPKIKLAEMMNDYDDYCYNKI